MLVWSGRTFRRQRLSRCLDLGRLGCLAASLLVGRELPFGSGRPAPRPWFPISPAVRDPPVQYLSARCGRHPMSAAAGGGPGSPAGWSQPSPPSGSVGQEVKLTPPVRPRPRSRPRPPRQFGVRGCAGLMAREFGDHPEAAMDRMRLDPELVGEMPASSVRPASGSTRPPDHVTATIRADSAFLRRSGSR